MQKRSLEKTKNYIIVILIILLIGKFVWMYKDHILNAYKQMNYNFHVSQMETIDADNFENLINDKLDSIIYIGSADCHYCIEMISDIQALLKKEGGKTFYWNVDLYNDFSDERILALFDSLGIETIPVVVVVKDNHVKCIFVEEIKRMKKVRNRKCIGKYIKILL